MELTREYIGKSDQLSFFLPNSDLALSMIICSSLNHVKFCESLGGTANWWGKVAAIILAPDVELSR
jgi:hypothetical protein